METVNANDDCYCCDHTTNKTRLVKFKKEISIGGSLSYRKMYFIASWATSVKFKIVKIYSVIRNLLLRLITEQECIPVGVVPAARYHPLSGGQPPPVDRQTPVKI